MAAVGCGGQNGELREVLEGASEQTDTTRLWLVLECGIANCTTFQDRGKDTPQRGGEKPDLQRAAGVMERGRGGRQIGGERMGRAPPSAEPGCQPLPPPLRPPPPLAQPLS